MEHPLASLLKRLKASEGRYLISVGMTPEEIAAEPKPTYGGKGTRRWLTADEYSALICVLEANAK